MTTPRTAVRDAYLTTLGIAPFRNSPAKMQKAALARAYELRSFEIGLVWTRATYFFTAQAAIFAAFALLIKESSAGAVAIAGALALLGLVAAWLGYLSARGSRFWQQNWEHHIDLLEDEVEGALHKTIIQQRGQARFSVSRSQIVLTLSQVWFWILMIALVPYRFFRTVAPHAQGQMTAMLTAVSLAAIAIALAVAWRISVRELASRIVGVESPLAPDPAWSSRGKPRVYAITRRESAAGWPAAVYDASPAPARPTPPPPRGGAGRGGR